MESSSDRKPFAVANWKMAMIVAAGCRAIRRWIADAYDDATADQVRTIYGGSVTPVYAEALPDSPHVDGLGAGRKGRDPEAFAKIIRLIAQAKGLI